jgi:CDP-glycerol glycerophosphotransferase
MRLARHPRRAVQLARSAPSAAYYRWQRTRPLDPALVAYAAYWYTAYSCNPRAVFERARTLAPGLRGVWVVDAEHVHVMPAGVRHVVSGSRDYYRLMARATYLVNNVNFPNDIVKRPGQVHLQTHHGTPLKTMGMDLVRSPHSRRRMNFPKLLRRVARWDYSVSQNAFTSEYWERVYPSGTYRSIETGYPRNDVLARATDADVARARAALDVAPGQTTVLYLPTHREYHPGYVPQLDPARLADALGPDHVLLMRAHYFYRGSAADVTAEDGAVDGRVRDVGSYPSVEELYLAADLLVTDYSSAMFDYAVLDRPIVVYVPDWEEYRTQRGTTFDIVAQPPGAVAQTEDELVTALASGRAWDDDCTRARQVFRERFCSLEDGRAAERVVRELWPAHVEGAA